MRTNIASTPYNRAYVEITNVCNRSCSFCHGTKRAPAFMSEERFLKVLDSLAGVVQFVYFHLMGEPLLHPQLARFVSLASSLGFKPCITTNGTLLPRVGKSLIDSGLYRINISVHSLEDESEQEMLDYLSGCMDFADESSKSGILTVLRLWNRGVDRGLNRSVTDMLHEKFTEPWHTAANTDGARLRHKLHLEYGDRFAWPDAAAENLGDHAFCYGLKDHFGVLVDGTVVPCCLDADGVIALGNIFEKSLAEILCSDRAGSIKEGFREKRCVEELCRRCGYSRRFKL